MPVLLDGEESIIDFIDIPDSNVSMRVSLQSQLLPGLFHAGCVLHCVFANGRGVHPRTLVVVRRVLVKSIDATDCNIYVVSRAAYSGSRLGNFSQSLTLPRGLKRGTVNLLSRSDGNFNLTKSKKSPLFRLQFRIGGMFSWA